MKTPIPDGYKKLTYRSIFQEGDLNFKVGSSKTWEPVGPEWWGKAVGHKCGGESEPPHFFIRKRDK